MFSDARYCESEDGMPRAKTVTKAGKARITITVRVDLARRLKAIAKANQRSGAWVVNYAIDEFLEKYGDNSAPLLPVRPAPRDRVGN